MRNIFSLFASDIRMISRNIIAFIVIIGISILPALYSWFNIASNWDPYSNTGGIGFAVCNNDKGYTYKAININAGNEISEGLKSNNKMGWSFVDEDTALKGVKDGTYYAAVIIPDDFSENLCSVTTGKFTQASLQYYENDKKNAIAPKMTNAGMTAIENEVKSAFVNTLTTVIATTLNITTDELTGNKDNVVKELDSSLNNIVTEIDTFNASIDVFTSTLDSLKGLIESNKKVMPDISDLLSKSGNITSDVKSSIDATRKFSSGVTDTISDILLTAEKLQADVDKDLDEVFIKVESSSSSAAGEMTDITNVNLRIISVCDTVLSFLTKVQDDLGLDCSELIGRFSEARDHQQILIDKLYEGADMINTTGSLPSELRTGIKKAASQCSKDISGLSSDFSGMRDSINRSVDSVYSTLESAAGLLQVINGDIPKVSSTLDSTVTTVDQLRTSFENIKKLMDNYKKKTNDLIGRINDIGGNNAITELIMSIVADPEGLGEFVAKPVKTETTNLYYIDNYGSAMSPFYTSLGIWVGGVVLAAVLRTDPTASQMKKLKRLTNTQIFFGRYLLFLTLAEIQALIIALGDLFFLKIQCNDIFLFLLTAVTAGFVFSMIIYSLTITFSVIGKALAVIILVIQVAGSGGTFPVEVLPEPFRRAAFYLPFMYSNGAFREAIAGPDASAAGRYLLLLLAYVPFALLLGLFLRRPCIRVIEFFDKRIHQSGVII